MSTLEATTQQVKRASLVKEPELGMISKAPSELSLSSSKCEVGGSNVSESTSLSSKLLLRPMSQHSHESNTIQSKGEGVDEESTVKETITATNLIGKNEMFCSEWSEIPFVMPPDEKVFQIRAEEQIRRRKEIERTLALPIAERTTFASRMGATIGSKALKGVLTQIDIEMEKVMEENKVIPILQTSHYHREKENMKEFIQKKREIFLVQMSLDTKRAEIRKLEDRTFQREEALRKSEEMLEEDTMQFDAFLKQNDEKVQEAIKNAELQMKLKQDKVAEIKKLNGVIAMLRSDVNKLEEALEDCKKYKDFLIHLSPKQWLDEQALVRRELILELKEKKAKERMDKAVPQKEQKGVGWAFLGDDDHEDDEDDSEVEDQLEEKIYFEQPGQLLEIFGQLEGENLALMQQSQDTEDALESLQTKFKVTRSKNEAKTTSLRSQLKELELSIQNEEERHKTLQTQSTINVDDEKHKVSFEQIAAQVIEIYGRCGLDYDISLSTIQMLTNIEAKLEECLNGIENIPRDFVEQTEKVREKERRYRMRAAKLLQQKKEQEERRQRSLARARAPIFRRKGPPPMFRSYIWQKRRSHRRDKDGDYAEDLELEEFLARDY